MIDFLLGVPGKLKSLTDRLTAARAGYLDNLDAAISTRAGASTAVSNADYTAALAAHLAGLIATLNKTPTQIVNYYSASGWYPGILGSISGKNPFKTFGGWALTAGVLKTALSLTGSGVINMLGAYHSTTTSKTIRMKLTLDGVVVFDSTSIASTSGGGFVVGVVNSTDIANTGTYFAMESVPFSTSCLFEIASSVTETIGIKALAIYKMH